MRRSRYEGSEDRLVTVLKPFVTRVTFFKYGETLGCQVKPEVLVAHAPLFRELTQVCANLAFKKGCLGAACLKIAHESKFEELSTEGRVTDWVQTMDVRLRIACRHVAKARIQKVPPRWLQHIDGAGMAALADSGQADRESDGPEVSDLAGSGRREEECEESEDSGTPEGSGAAGEGGGGRREEEED